MRNIITFLENCVKVLNPDKQYTLTSHLTQSKVNKCLYITKLSSTVRMAGQSCHIKEIINQSI